MKAAIHEGADLRKLSVAIIAQAVRDLKNRHQPMKQIDALAWLTGPDFPHWCEAMDAPYMDAFAMLTGGRARRKTDGENMTDDLDILSAFDGLDPAEARELATRIKTVVRRVLDTHQARRIRAAAIDRIMAEEGCIYPVARARLNEQRRAMSREIEQRSQADRITRAAAFYLIQEELNHAQS